MAEWVSIRHQNINALDPGDVLTMLLLQIANSCWWFISWRLLKETPSHDDVMKWKHIPRYWPFVRGIHRWPVNSPHKGQWHRALMFSLICALNKRLSKQSWGWWFETPSRSLWRHCNGCISRDITGVSFQVTASCLTDIDQGLWRYMAIGRYRLGQHCLR